ncbi:MAG: OsmC family peroxiredoxin [Chloroflexi bacterium]|nr:OsmC family peroxiredoxin [Chloroflexota bacterium]
MAEKRHATVVWNGDLQSGSGIITYVSSGVISRLPVSWAARTSAHGGKTSPEELLAAAHASCFSMAFSSRLAKNGTPATQLDVKAEVTFEQAEAGWKVASSHITVDGNVPGIDSATFERLAEDAKENCPISGAIKGNVALSVEATLQGA